MIRRRSIAKTVRSGTGRVITWKPRCTLRGLPSYEPHIFVCITVCFGTLGIIQWNKLVNVPTACCCRNCVSPYEEKREVGRRAIPVKISRVHPYRADMLCLYEHPTRASAGHPPDRKPRLPIKAVCSSVNSDFSSNFGTLFGPQPPRTLFHALQQGTLENWFRLCF